MTTITASRSATRRLLMGFLALQYCVAAICFASALSGSKASSTAFPTSIHGVSCGPSSPSLLHRLERSTRKNNGNHNGSHHNRRAFAPRGLEATKEDVVASDAETMPSSSSVPLLPVNGDEESTQDGATDEQGENRDETVIALLTEDNVLDGEGGNNNRGTSASRWKRRKQIALGLVASLLATASAARAGWLPGATGLGSYTDGMILRDATMTGLTSVLAVGMNRGITWGYEHGKYDSKTGRKITHILSAPLFIITWPLFSDAGGARVFAGLVTLTNMYRLYLAGTGDAAESSLANTISRSGDKSEVMGGPFIYVCLFQCFIMAFWRNTFPGVVAMTTMAAGDGMADIIGRNFGRNSYKWPFSDGEKSLVGTVAFAFFSFVVTTGISLWLISTGCLVSSLGFSELAARILAISCICAMVEVLPLGDDNFTVPGSAALLSAVWLR